MLSLESEGYKLRLENRKKSHQRKQVRTSVRDEQSKDGCLLLCLSQQPLITMPGCAPQPGSRGHRAAIA